MLFRNNDMHMFSLFMKIEHCKLFLKNVAPLLLGLLDIHYVSIIFTIFEQVFIYDLFSVWKCCLNGMS